MQKLPKISIITPSFNQGNFIEETINSVLSQDYPDLEYIVMDGGSTDDTVAILKSYSDQIDWRSEPDRGQSHAINKGLKKATGEVLGFINSDDTLAPGSLVKVGRFFANNPHSVWMTGICKTIDQDGIEIRKAITAYKNFWLHFRCYPLLSVVNYISQPATFWGREVVEKVGYFDEQWHYAMDYDYWLRVGKYYKLWYLKEYLADFRIHASSKAGASANAQFDGAYEIAQKHVQSSLLLKLHDLHDRLTVTVYRALSS